MTETKINIESSKELEMVVLGSMLTKFECLKIASENLEREDFYFNKHKTIFQVLKNCFKECKTIDISLIYEKLKHQHMKYIGDIIYITSLKQDAGTSTYMHACCEELQHYATKRQLIQLKDWLVTQLQKENNVKKIIRSLKDKIQKIETKIKINSGLNQLLENNSEEEFIEKLKETLPNLFKRFMTGGKEITIQAGPISLSLLCP